MIASKKMTEYFDKLDSDIKEEYKLARQARKKQYDPESFVEVKLAKNLAERVVGLISVVAPQIVESKVVQRILELEKKLAPLDWRVALHIALEVAQSKHCSFKNQKEAIEVGIRVGFAYVTLGVVSSPLEGFTSIDFKKRRDGTGEFFCMNFAGPIRNAGGTMAALSVIIADYVRTHMGYSTYDPDEKEVYRCHAELEDYHEYVTNLQYYPSKQESEFMMQHVPIEIGGDASEKYELSNANLKDLPRVPVNKLRSGYCLIHSSCLPLKAPKLWKQLSKWSKEMGLEHWSFLEQFMEIQTAARAKGSQKSTSQELTPDYNYIKDLVAGRPVFGHPLKSGAFRLRYGRSRTSGYSAMSVSPATMHVANDFLAGATHIKVERPSKGAAITACDTIDGPIVKLNCGSVVYLATDEEAKACKQDVQEILYLGDLLVSYGDFLDRAHMLTPAGYCPEFWIKEFEKSCVDTFGTLDYDKLSDTLNIDSHKLKVLFKKPLTTNISFAAAIKISQELNIPLHPAFTYFYTQVSQDELVELAKWLAAARHEQGRIIADLKNSQANKRTLEVLGVPHDVINKEYLVIKNDEAAILNSTLQLQNPSSIITAAQHNHTTNIELLEAIAPYRLRDKAGTFIGARMGRPEKAKMRKLTGSPHMLFPIGKEGGRLRSLQSALEAGKVHQDFTIFYCESCHKESVYAKCHTCDAATTRKSRTKEGSLVEYNPDDESLKHSYTRNIPVQEYLDGIMKRLKTRIMPDLIKGVRGTSNNEHFPEHLIKGFLRAKHDIAVNKDGTTRYDASEVTLTHFKPLEIGASVDKLKELGYDTDIHGKPLERDDQVLELFCQDLVLPSCPVSPDEGADEILLRTTHFLDELLVHLYKQKPFYNAQKKDDLIGHYLIGLAPHTSAGMIGRIIGFSKTQGFLAHPLYHAAMRRDCFASDTVIPTKKDGRWTLQTIGSLVESLQNKKLVDAYNTEQYDVSDVLAVGYDGRVCEVPVKHFTKHTPQPMIAIRTALGKSITVTQNHKFLVDKKLKPARELLIGDKLPLPKHIHIPSRDTRTINLFEHFKHKEDLMIRGVASHLKHIKTIHPNYHQRDSYPARIIDALPLTLKKKVLQNAKIAIRRDTVSLPIQINVTNELLSIIGLYIAQGYARTVSGKNFFS